MHGVALVLSLHGPTGSAPAAVPYCRPFDQTRELQHELERWDRNATGDDAIVRDSLRLPMAQVIVQTIDEKICKNANAAYKVALSGRGSGFSNQVYVISFNGYGVYAVHDPSYRYGTRPVKTVVIFDSRWRFLSMYHS
jgi:hypothetical protein